MDFGDAREILTTGLENLMNITMPRKARIYTPGGIQHIIIRGIEWKDIFRDTSNKGTFIERHKKIVIQTSTPCYEWVLMNSRASTFESRAGSFGLLYPNS